MFSNKGQGLSLNVVIIAALALIVLVVLAVIFTTKSAETQEKVTEVSGPAKLKLETLKLSYGSCRPVSSLENSFLTDFSKAKTPEEKDNAEKAFNSKISGCKDLEKEVCTGECLLKQ